MKGFRFKGFTFRPFRQLTAQEKRNSGSSSAWRRMRRQEPETEETTEAPALEPVLKDKESGWDYQTFYRAAKQAGASKIDLFLVAGRGGQLFLPATNFLFALPEQA